MYTLYAFIIKQNYIVAVSYLVQITAKFTLAISGGNKYKRLDSPMDIDNPNTKHDATQKRKFNTSNSYLSLADVDEPHDKWLSKISFNEVQEAEEDNLVKVQVNTSDTYRKVTEALKQKNTNFYTYQPKKAENNPSGKQINNIIKREIKQILPLFFIDLEPNNYNKDIYKIDKLLNTIVSFEPPKTKRDIPQCLRCQSHGHTKNYCNETPACASFFKCAAKTSEVTSNMLVQQTYLLTQQSQQVNKMLELLTSIRRLQCEKCSMEFQNNFTSKQNPTPCNKKSIVRYIIHWETPIYWSTAQGKTPGLIDFAVINAIRRRKWQIIAIPAIKKEESIWAKSSTEKATQMYQTENITPTSAKEVPKLINETQSSKSPGADLINGKILKELGKPTLPPRTIKTLTIIFNAALRLKIFSAF
uniref:Pre-C2HC domain-containing protein n=1 Tax=Vespula pensylvanica TaxID=30213 RepID=A0A834K6P9_VESPE|nr:hypothetical protein H0235_016334 [Vespula pensylvanica]